jgi:hypothetical protein
MLNRNATQHKHRKLINWLEILVFVLINLFFPDHEDGPSRDETPEPADRNVPGSNEAHPEETR